MDTLQSRRNVNVRRLENLEYMTIYSNIRILFQECNHIVYASFDILEAMSNREE